MSVNYKKEFVSGVMYTSIAKYAGIFISMIISFILARILEPEDFGVIGIATVIITFINLFTDFGLGPAIIQSDKIDTQDINSIFSFTFITGLFASILFCLSASFIACYYGNEMLVNIVRLLSINVLCAALNIVPNALLLKARKFKIIAIRSVSIHFITGLLAVIAALGGLGVYALAIQSVSSSFGVFVVNYINVPVKFGEKVYKNSLKKVLGFSVYQFMAKTINYFSKNIDKLVIGKMMNLNELGYYEKSYHLMQLPVSNLSYVFTPVMQPLFREFRYDMDVMFQKYGTLLRCISIIAFPLSAYLYFASPDLIHLFYGDKWEPAIVPFRLLSLSVCFQILLSTTAPIYQASNNVKRMFYNCIIEFIIATSCLVVGLEIGGLSNVAMMISLGIFVRFVVIYSFLKYKVFHVSWGTFFSKIGTGIIIAILCASVMFGIGCIFNSFYSIYRFLIDTIILLVVLTYELRKIRLLKNCN